MDVVATHGVLPGDALRKLQQSGLIGSVGLMLRKAWAKPALILSLIALLLLEGWVVFFSGALESMGLAVPVMVSVGAVLLAWLAMWASRRGWLS